jgi:hypothetical protein
MVPVNPVTVEDSVGNTQIWASAVNCPALMTECTNHYSDSTHRIHIRKQFESEQPLEEGFANVELLVLPQEPTVSVIRDDYEKELQEDQQQYLDGDFFCWKATKCKKLSMFLSLSLILGSIAGAIHVVEHLEPARQIWGWVTVCVGVPLLLPGALFVNWCLQAFQDALDFGSEKQGIIIDDQTAQGPYSPSCGGINDARDTADDADFRSVRTNFTDTAGCYFVRLPQARSRMPLIPKCGGNGIAQQAIGNGSNSSASVSSISSTSVLEHSKSGVSV